MCLIYSYDLNNGNYQYTYDGNTYTWQNGRKLTTITNTAQNKQISYKYNDNGIRTSKTVNGVTTNYYLDGTKVIYEKTGNNVIYYTYDENGNLLGLKYNGEQYYYIKNGQNDIIGILNSSLAQVVSYEYDSWGNILNIKDTNGNNITDSSNIGLINPYRYRSYRYDTETGMYYLQSRYYNPEWGRFINADAILINDLLGLNLYGYCYNNPIVYYDLEGDIGLVIPFVEASSGTLSAYWPAIWENIIYGVTVAWNEISSIYNSNYGVQTLPKVVSSTQVTGGCGSFERPMPSSAPVTPPSPQKPKKPDKFNSSSTNISKGSTAQIQPRNLREQLALEQVKSMPENGKILTKMIMKDPRWPATQGWVKMQQQVPTSVGIVNVHYVWNSILNIFDDFKIVP